jgi:hypothetical protein
MRDRRLLRLLMSVWTGRLTRLFVIDRPRVVRIVKVDDVDEDGRGLRGRSALCTGARGDRKHEFGRSSRKHGTPVILTIKAR